MLRDVDILTTHCTTDRSVLVLLLGLRYSPEIKNKTFRLSQKSTLITRKNKWLASRLIKANFRIVSGITLHTVRNNTLYFGWNSKPFFLRFGLRKNYYNNNILYHVFQLFHNYTEFLCFTWCLFFSQPSKKKRI